MTPADYVDDLPLDAAFDKALLQKVPSRLCAQVLCDGKPTEADMQTVLHTLKQVLESNDSRSPITTSPLCPPAITLTTARLWRMCWNPA